MPKTSQAKVGAFLWRNACRCIQTADEFKQHMDNWIERFRRAKPAAGYDKVLIPEILNVKWNL
jgi:LDH2 family malate/lactate/ureidoglycolate dehydrogenase